MPLYEYECAKCGERIEVIRSFSDPPLVVCPECGGALTKLLSSPAFQFKGSGFYLTDYGKSGSAGDRAGEKSEEKKEKDKDKEKSSSKGEEGKTSSAPGGGEAAGGGGSDSSKGKKDGGDGGAPGAATSSPTAPAPPAPSKKKSG
ncbi:MAG TPA: zinc ribbon domain-containing protein, partial [Thermoanaerobaculia bacterium]|nr:zinc ribbon domain-containing protein [Thermoanaerobaculia bacterium]